MEGPAFNVYIRLATEDKRDRDKIIAELLNEFERGQVNRGEAFAELTGHRRKSGESAQTFAYKLLELVQLEYPTFARKIVRR